MKTKTFLLGAIVALVVYSCSSDRDEQVQNPAIETKLDLKKTSNNQSETSKVGDSAKISTQLADPGEGVPITDPDPNEGDPKDVIPPKR